MYNHGMEKECCEWVVFLVDFGNIRGVAVATCITRVAYLIQFQQRATIPKSFDGPYFVYLNFFLYVIYPFKLYFWLVTDELILTIGVLFCFVSFSSIPIVQNPGPVRTALDMHHPPECGVYLEIVTNCVLWIFYLLYLSYHHPVRLVEFVSDCCCHDPPHHHHHDRRSVNERAFPFVEYYYYYWKQPPLLMLTIRAVFPVALPSSRVPMNVRMNVYIYMFIECYCRSV
jgi:hypothetical protein